MLVFDFSIFKQFLHSLHVNTFNLFLSGILPFYLLPAIIKLNSIEHLFLNSKVIITSSVYHTLFYNSHLILFSPAIYSLLISHFYLTFTFKLFIVNYNLTSVTLHFGVFTPTLLHCITVYTICFLVGDPYTYFSFISLILMTINT